MHHGITISFLGWFYFRLITLMPLKSEVVFYFSKPLIKFDVSKLKLLLHSPTFVTGTHFYDPLGVEMCQLGVDKI